MAIKSFDEIGKGKKIVPDSEIARVNRAAANRRLFDGNFAELGVGSTLIPERRFEGDAPSIGNLRENWFMRAATFFPEFMLAERPIITISGNERAQEALQDALEEPSTGLFPNLEFANVDMLRFGEGVVASHPMDPMGFMWFPSDQWYEVRDEQNALLGDVAYSKRGDPLSANAYIDIYFYPVNGRIERFVHKSNAGEIGDRVGHQQLALSANRQVVPLRWNINGTSIFDSMKDHVGEISRTLNLVSQTISRNLRPHLYGPENIIVMDEAGNTNFNQQGMFFPLQQDDVVPGYLQWDSKLETVSWNVNQHQHSALVMAGLSPIMFNPEFRTGDLSGIALRRVMLPTVARLNRLAQINASAIQAMVLMWNDNRAQNNLEVFQIDRRDIEIEWTFRRVFEDPAVSEGDADEDDGPPGTEEADG